MLQKINLQQLQSLNTEEIKGHEKKVQERKTELEALKAKGGKDWTSALQEELDNAVLLLVDIEDILEKKANKTTSYSPAPGTENMIHLSLVHGRRFNPLTGKEESKVFTQLFTFAEWQLFKKNYRNLGYVVMAVLHDPYNDTEGIITKN